MAYVLTVASLSDAETIGSTATTNVAPGGTEPNEAFTPLIKLETYS